jgi:hypothetical protein
MQVSESIKRSQVADDRLVSYATPQVVAIVGAVSGTGAAVQSTFLPVDPTLIHTAIPQPLGGGHPQCLLGARAAAD